MGISVAGYEEAMIEARRIREESLGFTVDLSPIGNEAPCIVCGKQPKDRTPYPGVVLLAYRDLEAHVAILGYGCTDCARLAINGLIPEEMKPAVRARAMEWVA